MRSVVVEEKRPPLRFGGFTLNPEQHALFCNQERVRITEKPLETLIFLVENRGRVVEKQELLNAVWKGTYVTEDTLVHAVREIRRALGDEVVLGIGRETRLGIDVPAGNAIVAAGNGQV